MRAERRRDVRDSRCNQRPARGSDGVHHRRHLCGVPHVVEDDEQRLFLERLPEEAHPLCERRRRRRIADQQAGELADDRCRGRLFADIVPDDAIGKRPSRRERPRQSGGHH